MKGKLKLVLNLVRPRYFLPVHGEYRQLAKHASLAQHLTSAGLEETFILESGDTLEIGVKGFPPARYECSESLLDGSVFWQPSRIAA